MKKFEEFNENKNPFQEQIKERGFATRKPNSF